MKKRKLNLTFPLTVTFVLMVLVVVLPWVPATQSPLCWRVSVPKTWARFCMSKPFRRKYCSS